MNGRLQYARQSDALPVKELMIIVFLSDSMPLPWEPLDKYELMDNMHMLDHGELDELHSPRVDQDVSRAALNEKLTRSSESPIEEASASGASSGGSSADEDIQKVIGHRLLDIYNMDGPSDADPERLREGIAMVLDALEDQEDLEWFLEADDEIVRKSLDDLFD